VQFTVNVQGLVNVVDVAGAAEDADRTVNLNAEVKAEADPMDPASLDKLFSNDLVAIDAKRDGSAFFIVSRGGNFVFRATLDGTGKLTLGSPPVRIATGNLPNGIVVSADGTRAYVNNELNVSVTSIDLASNAVLDLNVSTGTPPPRAASARGRGREARVLHRARRGGERAPREPLREIDPHQFRGRQSNNAWSSCASCHPDGLTDNVAWIFTDGRATRSRSTPSSRRTTPATSASPTGAASARASPTSTTTRATCRGASASVRERRPDGPEPEHPSTTRSARARATPSTCRRSGCRPSGP
jgi:hypothetical protein